MEISLIQNKIYEIHIRRVMLDFDLAGMFGVEMHELNLTVKSNISRFPDDFLLELS